MSTPLGLIRSETGETFEGPFALAIPEGNLYQPWVVAGSSSSFAFGVVNKEQLWAISLP